MSLFDGYSAESYVPVLVERAKPAPIVSSIKEDDRKEECPVMELLEKSVTYKDFVDERVKGYVGYCTLEWCDGSVYGWKCAGPFHTFVTGDAYEHFKSCISRTLQANGISNSCIFAGGELGVLIFTLYPTNYLVDCRITRRRALRPDLCFMNTSISKDVPCLVIEVCHTSPGSKKRFLERLEDWRSFGVPIVIGIYLEKHAFLVSTLLNDEHKTIDTIKVLLDAQTLGIIRFPLQYLFFNYSTLLPEVEIPLEPLRERIQLLYSIYSFNTS